MVKNNNDNWKKLRKNPAYIFFLGKKLLTTSFGKKKKKNTAPSIKKVKPDIAVSVTSPAAEVVQEKPEIVLEKISLDPGKPNIACIFDIFTKSCFSPEFNMINPTPENWQLILEHYPVDALFVESAWRGNDDAWSFKVGKYNEKNLASIKALLEACKTRNIPTIFWNKEDPVHFDKYIDPAFCFDYIYTTDVDCIPKYIAHAGHENVFTLPFAAQHTIHNPLLEEARDRSVCFAGTYYVNRYEDRRSDLDVILRPAIDFGLDIFDRMHGAEEKVAANFRFPDIYQPSIRGKLDYNEMVKAYRKYKVFLNVNSVRNSPTMFARRVFELLACGTPVISTYSRGIMEILGDDTVFITETEEDTRSYLEKLINDEDFWWKQSLHGMRKVLEKHTYHHRIREIFGRAGIKTESERPVTFLIVSRIHSGEDMRSLAYILNAQTYRNYKVLILDGTSSQKERQEIEEAINSFGSADVMVGPIDQPYDQLNFPGDKDGDYFAIIDPSHFYGENYLRDYALAIGYSGARKFGKASFHAFNENGNLELNEKGSEYRKVNFVLASTLVIHKDELKGTGLGEIFEMDTYKGDDNEILSIDPYNFLLHGFGAPEAIKKELSI